MSEPMTFQKKSRRERYIVRDDVVGMTGFEPAASCSQRIWEYLFPLISGHFHSFPLENTSSPAVLPPLFPCTPVVSVG